MTATLEAKRDRLLTMGAVQVLFASEDRIVARVGSDPTASCA